MIARTRTHLARLSAALLLLPLGAAAAPHAEPLPTAKVKVIAAAAPRTKDRCGRRPSALSSTGQAAGA